MTDATQNNLFDDVLRPSLELHSVKTDEAKRGRWTIFDKDLLGYLESLVAIETKLGPEGRSKSSRTSNDSRKANDQHDHQLESRFLRKYKSRT